MSLSSNGNSKGAGEVPYQMAEFGPARELGEGGPQTLDLPVFTDHEPLPEQPLLDRQGFSPLFLAGRDADPREAAEAEAKGMLESAHGEVETIRAQAKQSGYEAGYGQGQSEGREAASATMTATLDNLERIIAGLSAARANILANMEKELVALLAAATDLVLMRKGAVDPAIIKDVIAGSIARLTEVQRISVRLAEADLAAAEDFAPQLRKRLDGLEHLELVADPALARGDCLVDTDTAEIDATLAARRDQLLAVLDDAMHGEEPVDFSEMADTAPEPAVDDEPAGEDLDFGAADDDGFDLADSSDDEEDW